MRSPLPPQRPPTQVHPIEDFVTPEGRAAIERAKAAAAMNRITRKMDAVVQRLADLRETGGAPARERRRRGR